MPFTVDLSGPAREDIDAVLRYTLDVFGRDQRDAYLELIEQAIHEIARDPEHPPAKSRDELSEGSWLWRIGKPGQRARHLFAYRITKDGVIHVARLLHDSADITRHLSEDYLR